MTRAHGAAWLAVVIPYCVSAQHVTLQELSLAVVNTDQAAATVAIANRSENALTAVVVRGSWQKATHPDSLVGIDLWGDLVDFPPYRKRSRLAFGRQRLVTLPVVDGEVPEVRFEAAVFEDGTFWGNVEEVNRIWNTRIVTAKVLRVILDRFHQLEDLVTVDPRRALRQIASELDVSVKEEPSMGHSTLMQSTSRAFGKALIHASEDPDDDIALLMVTTRIPEIAAESAVLDTLLSSNGRIVRK